MTSTLRAAAVFALAAACLLACGPARGPKDPSPHAVEAPAGNSIDRLVLPRLAAAKVAPTRAAGHELCRRLAIDLLGRGPSHEDMRACTAAQSPASFEALVDAWMRRPEHDCNERRNWADLVQYDVATTWYAYIVDADDLAASLASATIGYDEFATRFVVHPAFYSRHPDEDWPRQIFSLFLGRTARPDEVRAFRPLVAVWSDRSIADPRLPRRSGVNVRELGFDFCACARMAEGCSSRALGRPIALPSTCPAPKPPPKLVPSLEPPPDPRGPPVDASGKPVRNLAIGDEADPLPHASAEQETALASIGAALVARPDFWEAAVDRELRRYLGWWQTAFKRHESDLPEVRAALAAELQRTKSIRALRRTIVTSVLYTMPSAERRDLAPGAAALRWAYGPRKLLAGEAWLDTMALAVGEELGSCDHRFNTRAFATYQRDGDDDPGPPPQRADVDPTLLWPSRSTLRDPLTGAPFDYARAAHGLGGCGAGPVPQASSLGLAQAQRDLAAVLCGGGRSVGITSASSSAALEDDARATVRRMLEREPTDEEARRLAGEMRACMAQKSGQGCADRAVAARWLCTRIATSTEFGTY